MLANRTCSHKLSRAFWYCLWELLQAREYRFVIILSLIQIIFYVIMVVLELSVLVEFGFFEFLVIVCGYVYFFLLLFAAISSRSTILSPALFCSSYKNPIQLSSSSINPQGFVKSNIITTTAFLRISGFWSWENICSLYLSSTIKTSSLQCVPE